MSRGFTLLELLIVVSLIVILTALASFTFFNLTEKARDSKRRADISAISYALEVNHGSIKPGICSSETYCSLQVSWFSNGGIPSDPKSTKSYCIWFSSIVGETFPIIPSPWEDNSCPPLTSSQSAIISGTLIDSSTPPEGTYSWNVCATLEGGDVICENSRL